MRLRRIAPFAYAIGAVVLWIVAPGKGATIFTVVGAIALGAIYATTGQQVAASGRGRGRDRRRNRDRNDT